MLREHNNEELWRNLNIKILLVEENHVNAERVKSLLNKAEYLKFSIHHISTLDEAKTKLEKENFDIILLDLGLDKEKGSELINRAIELKKSIPVIVLANFYEKTLERTALELGIQDYLIKEQLNSFHLVKSIYHAIEREKIKKQNEILIKKIQENEKKLNFIIQQSVYGILIVDNKGIIHFINSTAKFLLSSENKDWIGERFNYSIEKGSVKVISVMREDGTITIIEIKIFELEWDGELMNLIILNDITERKKFKQENEELAKIAIECPFPIIKVKHDRILYLNEAAKVCFKVDIGEKIPFSFKEGIKKAFSSGSMEKIEIEHNGHYYSLILNPEVDTKSIIIYAINITDKVLTNTALKESEIKYQSVIENLDSGICCVDIKGVYTIVNEKAARIMGGKPENFIGKSLFEVLPKELAEQEFAINEEIIKTGKGIIYEENIKLPEGVRVFFINKQPLLNAEGKIAGIQNIYVDITKSRESEKEVKKLEKILEEMNALIEHAPLAILLIEKEGRILRTNEAARNLFETDDAILNYHVSELFDESSKEKIAKHYNNDIFDLLTPNTVEAGIITTKGKKVDVEIYSTILKIADNLIIQSFISDISERKAFERHREKLLDELITSLEFKSKFLATMSHELRTPLNAILGFSELLLEGSYGTLNREQEDFLKDISSAGAHLLNLINSILDISKIDAGKFELNLEEVNLYDIIKETENLINPLYNTKNLKFIIEGFPQDATLIVDPIRFKQILFNLLSNAIKFTFEGSITLKGIEKEEVWEFQVIDTGIGIAEKDFPKIFKEFNRVENEKTRKIVGAGLGLALTKRLVLLNGGKIWFESELNKGTTFYFTIPKRIRNNNQNH
ncbi:MAG: PAS domain S-box protein [Promethearchaeota archaeon]